MVSVQASLQPMAVEDVVGGGHFIGGNKRWGQPGHRGGEEALQDALKLFELLIFFLEEVTGEKEAPKGCGRGFRTLLVSPNDLQESKFCLC